VDSKQVLDNVSKYLNLSSFIVLYNNDANLSMRSTSGSTKTDNITYNMGCDKNGKHDPDKLAYSLYSIYFDLYKTKSSKSKFFFDFDDTLFARDKKDIKVSMQNMKLIKKMSEKKKIVIISGNSFEDIKQKIFKSLILTDLPNIDIWADANSVLYLYKKEIEKYIPCSWIEDHKIDNILIKTLIPNWINSMGLDHLNMVNRGFITEIGSCWFCVGLKPIDPIYRNLVMTSLNDFIKKDPKSSYHDCKAIISGTTTIDIIRNKNSKKNVLNYYDDLLDSYYVGDEIDSGNDKEIADCFNYKLQVKDVYQTNIFLKVLLWGY
jgi:hypothetical protein